MRNTSVRLASSVLACVLFLAGVVHPANPGSAELVCSRPDIIVCDDWEDGDHVGWNWSDNWACGGDGDELCVVGVGGFSSNNALRFRIKENFEDTAYPEYVAVADVDTQPLYMRWYVRYSPGYVFLPGYSDGQKMAYFMADNSSGPGLAWRMMFGAQAQSNSNREVFQITVSSLGHTPVWTHNGPATHWLDSDRWYCVEGMLIGGDPGQSNGQMKLWVDDVLYFDHSGMNTKTNGDPVRRLHFTPWYGGNPGPAHPQQYVWYDNIVAARQRIGCAGINLPNPDLPPPSSVVRTDDIAP